MAEIIFTETSRLQAATLLKKNSVMVFREFSIFQDSNFSRCRWTVAYVDIKKNSYIKNERL